jgi:hypothetical protein
MLWAEAVKKAGTAERMAVIEALESGLSLAGPSGTIALDPKTHHGVLNVYLAELQGPELQHRGDPRRPAARRHPPGVRPAGQSRPGGVLFRERAGGGGHQIVRAPGAGNEGPRRSGPRCRADPAVVYGIAHLVLISLGLAIIFGMMRVINLAHGEFLMLGGYTVVVSTNHGVNLWVAMLILAPLVVGIIGIIVERALIQFLYGRMVDTLLATWGLSLLFIGLVTTIFGAQTGTTISPPLGAVRIGDYLDEHL